MKLRFQHFIFWSALVWNNRSDDDNHNLKARI